MCLDCSIIVVGLIEAASAAAMSFGWIGAFMTSRQQLSVA